MAKDFKAGQVKTSKIIGKDGTSANDKKIVFYTHDEAAGSDEGVHAIDLGGDDVSFVFSGAPGDRDATDGGVAVFNGDLVVSGTLYAENQIIEVTSSTSSSLIIEGANKEIWGEKVAIHITGTDQGHIMWDEGHASLGETGEKIYINANNGIHEGSTIIGTVTGDSANHIATCADINAEVSAVATAVADEITNRVAADLSLQTRLAADEAALAAEIVATNADFTSSDSRMGVEEAARAAGDLSLQTRLAADEAALAAEIVATNADVGSIDTRVAAEEGARASADGSLQTRLAVDEAALAAEIVATTSNVTSIDLAMSALGSGGGGSMSSFDIDDGVTSATITDGVTLDVQGGAGLKAVVSPVVGTTQIDINHDIGSLVSKSTPAAGDFLIIEDNSGLATIKKVDWSSLPSSTGGMTNFTIATDPATAAETIGNADTLTVAGANGLTSTVSNPDTLTITLNDTLVTPGQYGDATNVPQFDVDQQGRITGVTNVAISAGGGSSSAGAAGEVQISDGSGGFDAATVLKYHPTATPGESKVSIGSSSGPPQARLEVVNLATDSFNCIKVQQLSGAATNMMPVLIESNTNTTTADLAIANLGSISEIKLANTFNSLGPTFKSSQILMDNDDFKIINNQNDGIVQVIGSADPTATAPPYAQYDVIRGEGNVAHKPCVTILTDPGAPAAAIASTDINFYVEGKAGSLGSAVDKKSAQFGGDLKVDGFVSRGGVAHLTKDAVQTIIPYASDPSTSSWDAFGLNNGPAGNVIFDGSMIFDDDFYKPFATPSQDFIEFERDGFYKVSYGVFAWQSYHANWVNHPATTGTVIGERTALKSLLTLDTGGGGVAPDVPCSYNTCYLRRDWINKWCFVATTIVDVDSGDKLSLKLKWIQGNLPDTVELAIQPNQTWMTIEKIQ